MVQSGTQLLEGVAATFKCYGLVLFHVRLDDWVTAGSVG